jgi:hypothetical protein
VTCPAAGSSPSALAAAAIAAAWWLLSDRQTAEERRLVGTWNCRIAGGNDALAETASTGSRRRCPVARLILFRDEMTEYTPPPICMRCAAPSTVTLTRAFYWTRGGYFSIGFLGHLVHAILLLTGTRRFRMPFPLCAACVRRRRLYRGFVVIGLIALVGLAAVGIGLVASGRRDTAGPPVLAAATVWAVVLLFVWTVHHFRSIRPAAITSRLMVLVRVSPAFVDAVDLQRRNYSPALLHTLAEISQRVR